MKVLKFLTVPIFMAMALLSCKKSDNKAFNTEIKKDVTVKKGISTFKSIAAYMKITSNKNGEQQFLFDELASAKFSALASRASSSGANTNRVSVTNALVTPVILPGSIPLINTLSFSSLLYTNYLLNILNQDKICQIDNYLIKVDLDNGFCSVIDASLHPNETGDLVNNVFSNTNIMAFVNEDEPVMDVLTNISNNTLTWTQYQDMRASKGGPGGPGGFCFRQGTKSAYSEKRRYAPGGVTVAIARYTKDWIHFELACEGYSNGNLWNEIVTMRGKYEYEGACQGASAGNIYLPPVGWRNNWTIYSGGSALAVAKLEIASYSRSHGFTIPPASIGY